MSIFEQRFGAVGLTVSSSTSLSWSTFLLAMATRGPELVMSSGLLAICFCFGWLALCGGGALVSRGLNPLD